MMFKLRLAAVACCALGVSGNGPIDTTELVQSKLTVHGPPQEGVSLARQVSGKHRLDSQLLKQVFTSKRLAQITLGYFMKDGHRLSRLLWGNATAGVSGQQVPDAETAGCSAGDRQTATTKLQKLQDDFMNTMGEMLPKIMDQMQGGGAGGAGGLATPFGNGGEPSINIGDLGDLAAKVPAACKDVLSPQGSLEWASIMGCAKEVLGVSTECLNCIPQFGKQVQDGCGSQCDSALNEAATEMDSSMSAMQAKVMKSRTDAFGGMPSQQDMMEMKQSLQAAVSSGLKKLAPCGECVAPKATSFAGCMGGGAAAEFVRELADELNAAMRSGDLAKVEIGAPPQEQQRTIM